MPARKPDYQVYDKGADKWWALWVNSGSCKVKITRNEMGRWVELGSIIMYSTKPRKQITEDVPITLLNYIKP